MDSDAGMSRRVTQYLKSFHFFANAGQTAVNYSLRDPFRPGELDSALFPDEVKAGRVVEKLARIGKDIFPTASQ